MKLMTKFSNKFKKQHFWPIFGARTFFSKNEVLSRTSSHGPLTDEHKTNEPLPRKLPEERMKGQKDRRPEGQTDPNS